MSVKALKKSLHYLKQGMSVNNTDEIIFLSKLIRNRIKYSTEVSASTTSQQPTEKEFISNFWRACTDIFNRVANICPRFSIDDCAKYFRDTRTCNGSDKFTIPPWFVKLTPPTQPPDESPPTYCEVAHAIKKARGGASACPVDQISKLILKRCPILRTILHSLTLEAPTGSSLDPHSALRLIIFVIIAAMA